TTIAQDPRVGERQTWYYGSGEASSSAGLTGDSFAARFKGDGIFKSTDGGLNWTLLPSTSVNSPHAYVSHWQYITTVKVSPTTGSVYAARGYNASLMVSKDGGTTWTDTIDPGGSPGSRGIDIAITSTGIVYAVVAGNVPKSGIWRSTDDGATWTDISPSGWVKNKSRLVLDIAPSNENIVYIAGTDGARNPNPSGFYLYKYTYQSGDGSGSGGQWEDRSANKPQLNSPENWSSQGGYDFYIRVKPDDENTVFVAGTCLYRSTDGFTTTNNITVIGGYKGTGMGYTMYPNHHPDNHTAVFAPGQPNVMYSGHDGGISKTLDVSANEVAWSYSNGFLTTQFYHVSIDPSGTKADLIVGGLQDNGSYGTESTNNQAAWTYYQGGDGMYSAIGKSGEAIVNSYQNGGSYLNIPFRRNLEPPGATGLQWSNPIAMNPSSTSGTTGSEGMLFYVGGSTLWRMGDVTDATSSYVKLTGTNKGATIGNLGFSTENPKHRLYYATTNGGVYKLDNADVSAATVVPTDISPAGGPSNAWPNSIQVNPEDGNEVLLTYANYEVIS
ncbi:uncharacterized protein METZ01_LOCUS204729, partial [marine metagenome]